MKLSKKYFKIVSVQELCIVIFIFLLIGTASYFSFLKQALNQYQISKNDVQKQLLMLTQKKYLATLDKHAMKKLMLWKQQHPNFYNAISTSITTDQMLQLTTHLAQQSGFLIIQAALMIDANQNHQKKKNPNHLIHLQLSGSYQDLFYFLHRLNKTTWPFALIQLKIPRVNQFDIQLSARGSCD